MAAHDVAELSVFFHIGLQEDGCFLRIQAAGKIQGDAVAQVFLQGCRVLGNGDAMQIGDEGEYLVFILIVHEMLQCADIAAKMQLTCRLDAA